MTVAGKPAVVLFDVDETRVHTGGSGARSWKAAFGKLHGIPADIGEHSSAGETDPQVARATFRGVLRRGPSQDELGRLYAQYLLHLAEDIWVSEATGCSMAPETMPSVTPASPRRRRTCSAAASSSRKRPEAGLPVDGRISGAPAPRRVQ